MELVGRTALVTGGAAGTGRAIARRLDVEGAHVIVADLVRGDVGRFVQTDVTNPDPRLFDGVDVLSTTPAADICRRISPSRAGRRSST